MSYLHLPSVNMADVSKGTISLWFRFSKDSVDNARKHNTTYHPPDFGDGAIGPSIFAATIPLLTFGRKVMAYNYGFVPHAWYLPNGAVGATTFDSVQKDDSPCEPSHLGLVVDPVRGGLINEGVFLRLYFQMATRAFVQGLVTEATSVTFEIPPGGHTYQRYDVVKDISYIRTGTPETFEIIPNFTVAADRWHHLLVSFDFSNSVEVRPVIGSTSSEEELLFATVKSFCKVWYALDDENRAGKDNMGDGWVPHDPNGIIPVTAKQAAYDYFPSPPPVDMNGKPTVTGELYDGYYNWDAAPLPVNTGQVGLPASADYLDTIYHCEQAELQFFGGLALDTGITTNRRLFVTADGTPVPPEQTEQALIDRQKTEGPLVTRPHILLHGTSDWQEGANTGSTGIERATDGTEAVIPAGQFTPVARIDPFEPDPSLEEETA